MSKAGKLELGPRNAPYVLDMQFCGGWGYQKFADALRQEVDRKYPSRFKYIYHRDGSVTGRFEVTFYATSHPENV